MRSAGCVCLALVALASLGCSSDDSHPPEHHTDGGIVDNPRTCKEARDGDPVDAVVFIDGQAANCVGEEVYCSLADVAKFSGVCQVGKPSALCKSHRWQIECVELDAATGD